MTDTGKSLKFTAAVAGLGCSFYGVELSSHGPGRRGTAI